MTYALHAYQDYAEYVAAQVRWNQRKLSHVWVREASIRAAADYLRRVLHARIQWVGLCHGTRRGDEQRWFREYLPGWEAIIGTDIAPTAAQFPDTVQWDFHEVKPEWVGVADFIYSNSFDHAYDPEKALNAWVSCLRPHGLVLIEHSGEHGPSYVTDTDPFGADLETLCELVNTWGAGRYRVKETWSTPKRRGGAKLQSTMVVIERIP